MDVNQQGSHLHFWELQSLWNHATICSLFHRSKRCRPTDRQEDSLRISIFPIFVRIKNGQPMESAYHFCAPSISRLSSFTKISSADIRLSKTKEKLSKIFTSFLLKRGREREQTGFTMGPPSLKRQKLDIKEDCEDSSPFDMLPNEVVEIPIKMALKRMNTQERYDYLVEVLSKVSRRFRDIANHKAMWKGFSPFEMLPDNLAEIPIRMASNGLQMASRPFAGTHTNFLAKSLAEVSSRLKALATLKSQAIRQYVNDGTSNVTFVARGPAELSPNDI